MLKPGIKFPSWPHLNPIEAATVAKESQVKRLVLTHFEPCWFYLTKRESKLAERAAKKIFKNTISAFDEMELLI